MRLRLTTLSTPALSPLLGLQPLGLVVYRYSLWHEKRGVYCKEQQYSVLVLFLQTCCSGNGSWCWLLPGLCPRVAYFWSEKWGDQARGLLIKWGVRHATPKSGVRLPEITPMPVSPKRQNVYLQRISDWLCVMYESYWRMIYLTVLTITARRALVWYAMHTHYFIRFMYFQADVPDSDVVTLLWYMFVYYTKWLLWIEVAVGSLAAVEK